MTDMIEAVALEKLRADLDEATKQHMPAMVVTTDYLRGVLDQIAALQAELARVKRAMHDAIRRPMGVVPTSAYEFYSHAEADAAECRRAASSAALSELIAADAHLIDTLADSDGDDGA